MNLLRCLVLLKLVSFVTAQCSLAFPWLTSEECGVDPLDNSYPEYPVIYNDGGCGPDYEGIDGQTILGFATYTGTDDVVTDAYAMPTDIFNPGSTFTVSDIANTAIQPGSVVSILFTNQYPNYYIYATNTLNQLLTYTAVPKPSIFFTTATSTVQASVIATTTSSECKHISKLQPRLITHTASTSTVTQTSTTTLPQVTTTSECTVQTSTVTAKTSTLTITHVITPKPVTVVSTQYSWRTTKPACLPCKKAGAGQKRDLASRAHNRRLEKRQSVATSSSLMTYEVPNCKYKPVQSIFVVHAD